MRRFVLANDKLSRAGRWAIDENNTFFNSMQDEPDDTPIVLASKQTERFKFQKEQEALVGYITSQLTSTAEDMLYQDEAFRDASGRGDARDVWTAIRDFIRTHYIDSSQIGRMTDDLNRTKQGPNESLEGFAARFNEKLDLLDTFHVEYDVNVINQTFKKALNSQFRTAMIQVARTHESEGKLLCSFEAVNEVVKESHLQQSLAQDNGNDATDVVAAATKKRGPNQRSKNPKGKKQQPSTDQEIVAAILREIEKRTPGAQAATGTRNEGAKPFKCYACGQDHMVKNCPNQSKKDAWLKKREEYKARTAAGNRD